MKDNLSSLYDIECTDILGQPLRLQQLAGRPILFVNTASLCGFSKQFFGLESVWQSNKDKGLIVLGIPSNDFGQQEPGNNPKIVNACVSKFGISFPLLDKTSVSGSEAHPLFKWLAQEGGVLSKPRWNFYKYIIGRDGHLKNWFTTLTEPDSVRFKKAINEALETQSEL